MSDLSQLTGAGDTTIIPGYTLSPFSLAAYGEVEQELEREHMATAAAAGVGLPEALQTKLVDAAAKDVRNGAFNYGSPAFDRRIKAQHNTPFLLWTCLKIKAPQTSRAQADELLKGSNRDVVYWAILGFMGWEKPKATPPKQPGAATGAPSPGAVSLPDSALNTMDVPA